MAAGFTLAETLVALALTGLAMLLALSIIWQQPRILERLEAQRRAYRAIEATLETLRAGALPVEPGIIEWPGGPTGGGQTIWLTLAVEPTETPDLMAVTVRARYTLQGGTWQRSVETLFWRPSPGGGP